VTQCCFCSWLGGRRLQMAKLGRALAEGRTGTAPDGGVAAVEDCAGDGVEATSVKPRFFKALMGRGHPEFSSSRQQVRRRLSRTGWDPNRFPKAGRACMEVAVAFASVPCDRIANTMRPAVVQHAVKRRH
jgi:hypothetical protein